MFAIFDLFAENILPKEEIVCKEKFSCSASSELVGGMRLSSPNLSQFSFCYTDNNAQNDFGKQKVARIAWNNLDETRSAVCFDMDSTVIQEETLDMFAQFLGKDIRELTNKAMSGLIGFRESLLKRLALLNPTRQQYVEFVLTFEPALTSGIEELVAELGRMGVDVYIVTGGFREIADRVGQRLGIPPRRIFANRLLFNPNDEYQGIDQSQLTSRSGATTVGKAGVCHYLKHRFRYQLLVMVGDGSTDMEARPPADLFIGFGGNRVRENVRLGSDWFVTDFHSLRSCLREHKCRKDADKGVHQWPLRLRFGTL